MGIILKHSIRNILSKPLRLIVLIVCIAIASFAALLALDMSNNIVSLMNGYLLKVMGNVNIYALGAQEDDIQGVEEIADMTYFGIGVSRNYVYTPDPTDYHYVVENKYGIYSFTSVEAAVEMKMFKGSLTLDDSTAIASPEFMEMFDKEIGDTVTIDATDGSKIELTISDIYEVDSDFMSKEALIVTENTMKRINCTAENQHTIWFFYVKDPDKVGEVSDYLHLKAPKASVTNLIDSFGDDEFTQMMTSTFYLIFVITLLLVTFVTISMSEKIVNERMSVIGTLRSLGVRPRKTALLLLVENALYAVIGGGIGTALYLAVKVPLINMFVFFVDSDNEVVDLSEYYAKTPALLCVAVILGAILLECAYPLYELLKAVKTPIRDIIFNNKDTEFKYTWRRIYIGGGLVLISVVSAFMVKSFTILCISLAAGVVALAVLLPFGIRILSRLLSSLFRRAKMPVAQLAAENISRNKSIMGNAILSVISILLTTLILAVSGPVWKWLVPEKLLYDVRVYINYADGSDYSYFKNIDGVKEMDIVHEYTCYLTINPDEESSDKAFITVCRDEPHTLVDYLPGDAYGLSSDEIVISNAVARKFGINAGDVVEVSFHSDTKFPNNMTFTVADTFDSYDLIDGEAPTDTAVMIINADLYDRIFLGTADQVLFTSDDPIALASEIKSCTNSEDLTVETAEKIIMDMEEYAQGLKSLLTFIIFGSTVLTLIGVSGNQTFSFITRKRETALLYSVAMGRPKIRRLLFLESLFSIGLTTAIALVAAPAYFYVLSHIMRSISDGDLEILRANMVNVVPILLFVAVIAGIYILSVLTPFRALSKMNISEELKYE